MPAHVVPKNQKYSTVQQMCSNCQLLDLNFLSFCLHNMVVLQADNHDDDDGYFLFEWMSVQTAWYNILTQSYSIRLFQLNMVSKVNTQPFQPVFIFLFLTHGRTFSVSSTSYYFLSINQWCSYMKTRSPAKARFGRPYGKNGRLGGHIGETGSRNTAATQKINSLALVSYSLLQTVFR